MPGAMAALSRRGLHGRLPHTRCPRSATGPRSRHYLAPVPRSHCTQTPSPHLAVLLLVQLFFRQACEMLARWERREFTKHRFPLTEPVFEAMCSLAIAWGWDRWVAATLLGSTDAAALARPSARQELTCRRSEVAASPSRRRKSPVKNKNLCTPGDLLRSNCRIALWTRGAARVQHTTVQWVQCALCRHESPSPCPTCAGDRLQWPSTLARLLLTPPGSAPSLAPASRGPELTVSPASPFSKQRGVSVATPTPSYRAAVRSALHAAYVSRWSSIIAVAAHECPRQLFARAPPRH